MPGSSWFAWRIASAECGGAAHDGADWTHARMRHCTHLQDRSQKLFLSIHAEELSDLAIRHAALLQRRRPIARSGLPEGRTEKYRYARKGSASRAHSYRERRGQELPP